MALIDKLTAIADAIRTMTGGTDALTLDEMATAISSITGAGGADICAEVLLTLEQDMRYPEVIEAAQFKFRYENSIVFLIGSGSVAPSSGSYTLNNFLIFHSGIKILVAFHQYITGLVPPDRFKYLGGVFEKNSLFYISDDGVLGSTAPSTSCMGGPGTVVQAIEIPINAESWSSWAADGTLWESAM